MGEVVGCQLGQMDAAHRAGIREIILPAGNARDLEEVPDEVKVDLRFHLVSRLDEVLPLEKAAQGLKLIEDREVFGKVIITP